jgi:squalene-hopene/tetraprenyl-beta-curcumene cyclase
MTKAHLAIVLAAMLAAAGGVGCRKSETPTDPAGKGKGADPGAAGAALAPVTMTLSAPKAATTAIDADRLAKAQELLNSGIAFLLSRREADGGWSLGPGDIMKPAVTALVLQTLLGHPDFDRTSPVVKKGFEVLLSYRQKDGAIFDPKQGRPAYTTAIAVSALAAAQDPAFNEAIRGGSMYLQGIQIQPGQESPDGEPITKDSPQVGGVGYGKNKEPNLSVLQFAVEAWRDAGVEPDDEAMKQAVAFITRLQNRSESNPMTFAREGLNDGGFVYDLATSKAGEGPGGRGMRSYGSMTYAAFKSMLYAGVDRTDRRVQAAFAWIRSHWRLDSNPNMPKLRSKEGLFYYYHVFAKALRAYGADEIAERGADVKHNWRNELIDALAERVAADGSWVNNADRWHEGSPILVTCYGVLALEETLKK